MREEYWNIRESFSLHEDNRFADGPRPESRRRVLYDCQTCKQANARAVQWRELIGTRSSFSRTLRNDNEIMVGMAFRYALEREREVDRQSESERARERPSRGEHRRGISERIEENCEREENTRGRRGWQRWRASRASDVRRAASPSLSSSPPFLTVATSKYMAIDQFYLPRAELWCCQCSICRSQPSGRGLVRVPSFTRGTLLQGWPSVHRNYSLACRTTRDRARGFVQVTCNGRPDNRALHSPSSLHSCPSSPLLPSPTLSCILLSSSSPLLRSRARLLPRYATIPRTCALLRFFGCVSERTNTLSANALSLPLVAFSIEPILMKWGKCIRFLAMTAKERWWFDKSRSIVDVTKIAAKRYGSGTRLSAIVLVRSIQINADKRCRRTWCVLKRSWQDLFFLFHIFRWSELIYRTLD